VREREAGTRQNVRNRRSTRHHRKLGGARECRALGQYPQSRSERMSHLYKIALGAGVAAIVLLILAGRVPSPQVWAASGNGDGGAPTFTDYHGESPGTTHHITVADLPAPYATESVDAGPHVVPRPYTPAPGIKPMRGRRRPRASKSNSSPAGYRILA
jgi:hypothetical protein